MIPLANSQFLSPVLDAIRSVSGPDFGAEPDENIDLKMSSLRRAIRHRLKDIDSSGTYGMDDHSSARQKLEVFVQACDQINYGIIATLQGRFPVFLVPGPGIDIDMLQASLEVRIFWDSAGWYLRDTGGRQLFSFDLPPALFLLYSKGGVLSKRRALDLKGEIMSEFQAIWTRGGEVKVITFRLDEEWLDYVRERLERRIRSEDDRTQA